MSLFSFTLVWRFGTFWPLHRQRHPVFKLLHWQEKNVCTKRYSEQTCSWFSLLDYNTEGSSNRSQGRGEGRWDKKSRFPQSVAFLRQQVATQRGKTAPHIATYGWVQQGTDKLCDLVRSVSDDAQVVMLTDVAFINPDLVVVHQRQRLVVGDPAERRKVAVLAQVGF